MEFSPTHPIIKRCLEAGRAEAEGRVAEAIRLYGEAWDAAAGDPVRFYPAFFLGRLHQDAVEKLAWLERAREIAVGSDDLALRSALPSVYRLLAGCGEARGEAAEAQKHLELAGQSASSTADPGPFFHGTKADLRPGDSLLPGGASNYQAGLQMNHIYFTALAGGAGLAAAMAKGDGPDRVYVVEPTGAFEPDPNVTDKKFPGNPTRSYRSQSPLKIVAEVKDWARLDPEQLQRWRTKVAENRGEIIN